MAYTGLSCPDIHNNNPETVNKSEYYHINDTQWTYCNITAIAIVSGDFISICAGVGGGWRRIVKINISAGDNCPGEWRKATHSGVSFCRPAADIAGFDANACSYAIFSTNNTNYTSVCGRARGYQKGDTWGFHGVGLYGYLSGLSLFHQNNYQHIWTYVAGATENTTDEGNCPYAKYPGNVPVSFVGNSYYCEPGSLDEPDDDVLLLHDFLWDGEGCIGGTCCDNTTNLGSIIRCVRPHEVALKHEFVQKVVSLMEVL